MRFRAAMLCWGSDAAKESQRGRMGERGPAEGVQEESISPNQLWWGWLTAAHTITDGREMNPISAEDLLPPWRT